MRYRLHMPLILLAIGLPAVAANAQNAPATDATKSRKTTYYEELLLQGVHPLEAQIRDDLLHTRLIWDCPMQAFQKLDELEKKVSAIPSDDGSVRQAIARARDLIHEERTALEVNCTPLEEWAKRVDERPSDLSTLNKYVRKVKDLFGFRGNARANLNSVMELKRAQAQLAQWEQRVTEEEAKKRYSTAKAELARIERAFAAEAESRDSKE
jgi:hypothetical protein